MTAICQREGTKPILILRFLDLEESKGAKKLVWGAFQVCCQGVIPDGASGSRFVSQEIYV